MDSRIKNSFYKKLSEVLVKEELNILQLIVYKCANCRVMIIDEDEC